MRVACCRSTVSRKELPSIKLSEQSRILDVFCMEHKIADYDSGAMLIVSVSFQFIEKEMLLFFARDRNVEPPNKACFQIAPYTLLYKTRRT